MKKHPLILPCICLICWATIHAATTTKPSIDNYEPGPDSKSQPNVPKGATFSFRFDSSKIFPGTSREVSVYIPAQYKADKPACVYVGFDGLGFNATTVFDNLIARGEIPVLIGVGIQPGTTAAAEPKRNPRFNRSVEFDGLDDSLARFVVTEIFPEIGRRKTPDGLPIKLSTDPNDRCTGGASTGGIAAFNCAWQQPDQFRRVFSAIGTFVDMRGGSRLPILIRETEPKPIRVFQQDGENDEWMGGPEVGDWWIGNQYLDRSLEFAGYEHTHIWGDGPHGGKHATAIFPDAMRYLWKDWPKPVEAHEEKSGNVMLREVVDPAEKWRQVSNAATAGRDGIASDSAGKIAPQPAELSGTTTTAAGNTYFTKTSGELWLVKSDGTKAVSDDKLSHPTGVAVSPDGLWLAVMEGRSHTGFSYRILPDGTVDARQQFYWLQTPDSADDAGIGQICFDRDGRLYAATRMGIQVLDRNGRSRAILPLTGNEPATGVCFGGEKFDTLFVVADGKMYQRKMKSAGLPPGGQPITLPPWGAG